MTNFAGFVLCLWTVPRHGKCRKCKHPIQWVMELASGDRKAAWRPFKVSAAPIDVYENERGMKIAKYPSDSWHKCVAKEAKVSNNRRRATEPPKDFHDF